MSIVFRQTSPRMSSWQVPQFEYSASHCPGWVEEMIQEGEGYLSSMKSFKNLHVNMRLFEGIFIDKVNSTLFTNFVKYNVRKFVETISDIREIGIFGSDAPQYKQYAEIENKVLTCIFNEAQYPRQLRKVLQWASVSGVGYMWPKCKTTDYGFGERQIIFEPLGLLDVLPVQVPKSNDTQEAYVNTIFDYMPIAEAHALFPLFQSELVPVNDCTYPSRFTARRLDWAEKFRYGSNDVRNWGNLYCEVRYTYVRDLRINRTGHELPMGDAGTSWFYKVPTLGQDIFGGYRNGSPYMRPANAKDCRIYPNLRLIITSPGVSTPMYDGPAFDWHGQMPAVMYTVDDWPFEAMGGSLVESVASIERTKRLHERKMDQVLKARLNPSLGYDRTSAGGPKIEQLDIFEENVRLGLDGIPKQTLQSILPDEVQVTDTNYKWLEYLRTQQQSQMGLDDMANLMAAKLNLDSDGFDKVLESIGPIAKGIAASVNAGNSKVTYQLKFMIPQWMDARRIIQYVGADKVTPQMYDYDPQNLVPSHLVDEYMGDLLPFDVVENVNVPRPSRYDLLTRARVFASNLRLIPVESNLLKITQQQEQLKYLQLFRGGFPISPHTVAKKLGIQNYGDISGDTEFEKWTNWQNLQVAMMAQKQALASQLGILPDAGGAPPSNGATGKPEGRPPSGKVPPHLEEKGKHDGNPRVTVAESK